MIAPPVDSGGAIRNGNDIMRRQFSFEQVFLMGLVVAVVLTAAFVYSRCQRHQRSESAKRQLAEFCRSNGGNFWMDLVDGDIHLNLARAHLSASEIELLPGLLDQCISSDLGGRCRVHLNLASARIDGNLLDIVNENTAGLSLEGLSVDDAFVDKIVGKCPRLQQLNLDETQITDSSIAAILRLPIQSLSLRKTAVSFEALRKLRECRSLYELYVPLADDATEKLQLDLPGCEINQQSLRVN